MTGKSISPGKAETSIPMKSPGNSLQKKRCAAPTRPDNMHTTYAGCRADNAKSVYYLRPLRDDLANLIRMNQIAEGHVDCLATGKTHCEQMGGGGGRIACRTPPRSSSPLKFHHSNKACLSG